RTIQDSAVLLQRAQRSDDGSQGCSHVVRDRVEQSLLESVEVAQGRRVPRFLLQVGAEQRESGLTGVGANQAPVLHHSGAIPRKRKYADATLRRRQRDVSR